MKNVVIGLAVFCFFVCPTLHGMQKANTSQSNDKSADKNSDKNTDKNAAPTAPKTQKKAKNPSLVSSSMLAIAQIADNSRWHKAAKLAASLTDDDHATAVYFLARQTKDPQKKRELFQRTASLDLNRPSSAVTKAALAEYNEALELARQNWINIARYKTWDKKAMAQDAIFAQKLFDDQIKKAQDYYFKYLRAKKLDEGKEIDEQSLQREATAELFEIQYRWNLKTFEFHWSKIEYSSMSPEIRKNYLDNIFDTALQVKPAERLSLSAQNNGPSQPAQKSSESVETQRAAQPAPLSSDSDSAQVEPAAAASSSGASPHQRKNSNADTYTRVTSPGGAQSSRDYSVEQGIKHIIEAKNFLRNSLKLRNPGVNDGKIDEHVQTTFIKLKNAVLKEKSNQEEQK